MLRALIFDWGDTVMRVFPEYSGPMAGWPRVESVPGIEAALTMLHADGRYRLVLATNAADSDAAAVWDALKRVGLAAHFSAVVTARELGSTKPHPAFFAAAVAAAGCSPAEGVAIGDNYQADVVGAKAAGLRAVWFNPGMRPCPEDTPAYDAEVTQMSGLPLVLEALRLPDVPSCLALLRAQGAGEGLQAHCRLVAAVAFRLAERLRAAGEPVDPLLAHRGGLLHDLAKASARERGRSHEEMGAELLRGLGHPDLARIAERHAVWCIADPQRQPETWEEKLVYYADRLAERDRLVGITRRLEDMTARRPELTQEFARYRNAALALEREIAARLGVSCDGMLDWVGAQLRTESPAA